MSILHFADTTSALVGEQIKLTGSLGAPNTVFGIDGTDDGNIVGDALAGWGIASADNTSPYFQKGSVMKFDTDFSSLAFYRTHQSSTTWNSDKDFTRHYFVRGTYQVQGGDEPPTGGVEIDAWHSLAPDGDFNSWSWTCSSKFNCTSQGTVKIEISTDLFSSFFDTTTGVNGTTEVITTDAVHGLTTGDGVRYSKEGGSAAIGIFDNAGISYFVNVLSTTTFSLHGSRTNALGDLSRINLTASGAETHAFYTHGNVLATGYYRGIAQVLT